MASEGGKNSSPLKRKLEINVGLESKKLRQVPSLEKTVKKLVQAIKKETKRVKTLEISATVIDMYGNRLEHGDVCHMFTLVKSIQDFLQIVLPGGPHMKRDVSLLKALHSFFAKLEASKIQFEEHQESDVDSWIFTGTVHVELFYVDDTYRFTKLCKVIQCQLLKLNNQNKQAIFDCLDTLICRFRFQKWAKGPLQAVFKDLTEKRLEFESQDRHCIDAWTTKLLDKKASMTIKDKRNIVHQVKNPESNKFETIKQKVVTNHPTLH